jgi:hypothetical protein
LLLVIWKRQENPSTSCWEIKEPSIGKGARVGQGNKLKSFQFEVFSFQERRKTAGGSPKGGAKRHQLSFKN